MYVPDVDVIRQGRDHPKDRTMEGRPSDTQHGARFFGKTYDRSMDMGCSHCFYPMFRIIYCMSLIHVTIHVSDIEKSIEFYRDNLDLQVVRRFESRGKQIAMLGIPEGTLLEIVGDGNGDVDCPDISIGFSVNNAAALARRLDPQCIGPISPNPHLVFFIIRDPDGHRVQLLEHLDR